MPEISDASPYSSKSHDCRDDSAHLQRARVLCPRGSASREKFTCLVHCTNSTEIKSHTYFLQLLSSLL
eukprot:5727902-Pleurochrysis_carterae.AAC.1